MCPVIVQFYTSWCKDQTPFVKLRLQALQLRPWLLQHIVFRNISKAHNKNHERDTITKWQSGRWVGEWTSIPINAFAKSCPPPSTCWRVAVPWATLNISLSCFPVVDCNINHNAAFSSRPLLVIPDSGLVSFVCVFLWLKRPILDRHSFPQSLQA